MLIIRGRRVALPDGERAATLRIHEGRIASVGGYDEDPRGADLVDAGDCLVSPGLVDTHVHVNEPGRADWEGFDTATRAAAAGGITTLIDMPLNSVPATTTVEALAAKRAAARGRIHVDVGFWGGVVPGNQASLEPLLDAGVRGFKCFLAPSGVDEFEHVGESDLRTAMPILARRSAPLLVHAEDPALLRYAGSAVRYADYLGTRPPDAERSAIEAVARLAQEMRARVHIVHVASAEAVAAVAAARRSGVRLTAETCPHYLTFAAEEIRDGATAWGGIASLELSLAAVNTGFSRAAAATSAAPSAADRSMRLAAWLSGAPAALAGLEFTKGRLAPGYDADVVIWDDADEWTVDASRLQQRHKLSPYDGRTLRGRVVSTWLRGRRVWHDGALETSGHGQLL
jgi:allantoinase